MSASQFVTLYAQFVQAGFGHVLRVGLQFGRGCRELAAPITSLIEQLARIAQSIFDLRQPGAHLFGFKLQQAIASLGGIALSFEFFQLSDHLLIFGFAL